MAKQKWDFLTKICLTDNFVEKHDSHHLSRVKVCLDAPYKG